MKAQAVDEPVRESDGLQLPGGEIHLLDLLIVLAARRKLLFWIPVAAALLATVAVFVIPSEYTATTVVLPPQQNSSMGSSLLGELGGNAGAMASMAGLNLGLKNPGEMYVSLFRMRSVEDTMIERFGLMARYRAKRMSDARQAFEKHAKVVLGTKDGLITISVTDRDPKIAAALANGYVDAFRNLSATLAITEASQRRAFFEQQLKEANSNLSNAEEALKSTQHSTGVLQMDSQARSLIESAAVLRGQISAKEVEIQGMRSFATEGNPQLVVAEQELAGLKAQLAKLAGSDANSNSDIIVPKGNIPQSGMEYLRKVRDVKYYTTIEELIAKQFELAKLDEARQGAVIQVADVAVPPDKRSFPKRTLFVCAAVVLAFFLTFSWCLVANGVQRLRNDPAESERLAALRAAFSKQ